MKKTFYEGLLSGGIIGSIIIIILNLLIGNLTMIIFGILIIIIFLAILRVHILEFNQLPTDGKKTEPLEKWYSCCICGSSCSNIESIYIEEYDQCVCSEHHLTIRNILKIKGSEK